MVIVLDLEFRMFLWDTQSKGFHSKSSVSPYSAFGLILPPANPSPSGPHTRSKQWQ